MSAKAELFTVLGIIIILVLILMTSIGCGHQIDTGMIIEKKTHAGYYMTTMVGKCPVMQWYAATYKVRVRGRGNLDGLTREEWFRVKKKVFNNHHIGDTIVFNKGKIQ